ncbi:two-component system response regulator [Cellvibrio mixtus]|jgi:CheY-like chemotaxis protein|uniref:Two-component system response regulator n=1 Tax=Cellvibrio mixtus TaxID=39650 RepID=A0A266Q720_9GAMM|nr:MULTISPECIES: response regulator [Cellvibrio]AQT59681.1 two-component system response regulator [Cellvibrio sp. PSBB023]OZY85683.1 two-component system response regulator [Cellvibrio mixtus]
MINEQKINILLVDDDDVSAESVVRSLRKNAVDFPITLARDGMEALEILRETHPHLSIEKPYLVLLDLNMPRMNGFEFLHEVRGDKTLHSSVIFVLTTSDAESDRMRAYEENIAGYMVKSVVGPQFSKLASLLESYRSTISLPN